MATRESLRTKLARLHWQSRRREQVGVDAGALLLWTEAGIHLTLAAVLAGGQVFQGSSPFGVALVGAAGSGLCGAAALMGACLGYLTLKGLGAGLRYAAASILTFAVGFAFYDVKYFRRPWVMPLLAGFFDGCTGFLIQSQQGWRTVDVIYFFSELVLTVLSCWCYRQVLLPMRTGKGDGVLTPVRRASLLVLVATVLLSVCPVYLWMDVSLGRSLGAALVLAGAWQGGIGAGAVLGVSLGLSMDLASGGSPLYAMACGLSGLVAGYRREKGRWGTAGLYVLVFTGAVLWTWDVGLSFSAVWEACLGGMAFLGLPRRTMQRLGVWLAPAPPPQPVRLGSNGVRRKLEETAQAFRTLYESMRAAFYVPRNDNDIAEVFDRAAGRVCRNCTLRGTCWERDYVTTFNALNDATEAMLARGRGEAGDFQRYFSDRCLHFNAFLGAVNEELTALLARRQYNSRVRESRAAVCRQYGELSSLLLAAASELGEELAPDPKVLGRLRQQLALLGVEAGAEAGRDSRGLLVIRLLGEDSRVLERPEELSALSQALGVPLCAEREEDILLLRQQEPLMAVAGVAGRRKDGETVSGDSGTYFKGPGGQLFVLLCDGMGSGAAANRESSLAVRLLEQFLQAGVDTEHALLTLNSALALRGEEEGGFTTVDLLQVDLFTGAGTVFKFGAAPTYLKHGEEVRRLTGNSLPAGLTAQERTMPDRLPVQLEPGDCVLMVSDGVAGTEDDGWVREKLAKFDGVSPKALAVELIAHSPREATDDRTALVVRIGKREAG